MYEHVQIDIVTLVKWEDDDWNIDVMHVIGKHTPFRVRVRRC